MVSSNQATAFISGNELKERSSASDSSNKHMLTAIASCLQDFAWTAKKTSFRLLHFLSPTSNRREITPDQSTQSSVLSPAVDRRFHKEEKKDSTSRWQHCLTAFFQTPSLNTVVSIKPIAKVFPVVVSALISIISCPYNTQMHSQWGRNRIISFYSS